MTPTALIVMIGGMTLAAPVPKDATPRAAAANTNAVLKAHAGKFESVASTTYNGYKLESLFDGDERTVWYSASGDAPVSGTQPWVKVTLPVAVTVTRVTILGSRDAGFPEGYFATEGQLELLDKDGKALAKETLKAAGAKRDFDVLMGRAVEGVWAIKFTITKDEGKQNCIALTELQVE